MRILLSLIAFLTLSASSLFGQRKVVFPLIDNSTQQTIALKNSYTAIVMGPDSIPIRDITPLIFTHGEGKNTTTNLELKIPRSGKYILSLYIKGYHVVEREFLIKKTENRKLITLDALRLTPLTKEEAIELGEVNVVASNLKFYFDSDTLVYNANWYLRQEGTMLSSLLQKMPGLEIKPDGEIYSNGKRVDVLLLNGKDFFNDDRLTILANLPAYAIKQVRVYESRKINEEDSFERNRMHVGRIMDIKLKYDFQSANFGNVDLGGGTDTRYYAKVFGLRYGTNYRISSYAMSNNINRNENLQLDGTAQNLDNTIGEKQHHKAGINYNYDDYKGRFSLRGSAQLQWTNIDLENKQTKQLFLPTDDVLTVSNSNSQFNNFSFQTNHELNPWANKPYGFIVKSNLSYTHNRQLQNADFATLNASTEQLPEQWMDSLWTAPYTQFFQQRGVNRQVSKRDYFGESTSASVTLQKYRLKLAEEHHLGLYAAWNFYHHDNNDYTQRKQDYVATSTANLWQHQYTKEWATRHKGEGSVDYSYQVSQRSSFLAKYLNEFIYYDTDHSLFALDALNNWKSKDGRSLTMLPSQKEMLSVIDINNSYAYTEKQNKHKVAIGYNLALGRGALTIMLPIEIEKKSLSFTQRQQKQYVERSTFMPTVDVEYSKYSNRNFYIMAEYHLMQQTPTLYNLIDLTNTSNPLFVVKGNPDLQTQQQHQFEGQIALYPNLSFHSFHASGIIHRRSIAQSSTYEIATGRTTIQPRNVDGNYNIGFNMINRIYLNSHATASVENNFSLDFARSVDYISITSQQDDAYLSKVLNRTIKENFTYSQSIWQQRVHFSLTGYCNYNRYTSKREGFKSVNSFDFGGKFVLNLDLPKGYSLSTDLVSASRRGYNYDAMNTDEYLWNARLTKAFGEHIQFQFEVSDILAQRKSFYHVINAQSHIEEVYNGLRRYCMIHLIWRLGRTPKQTN